MLKTSRRTPRGRDALRVERLLRLVEDDTAAPRTFQTRSEGAIVFHLLLKLRFAGGSNARNAFAAGL